MRIPAMAAALLLPLTYAGVAGAACTRDALRQTVDGYFSALAAHDTGAVRLSPQVRFTEDGHPLQAGEGFWRTAGEVVFKRSALDVETCATVTQSVIKENGRDIIFGVRLKLDDSLRISEIEHIIAREQEFAFKPQGILDTRDHDWEGILQPEERASRAAMVAGANDYYDMFVAVPEVNAPFAAQCDRWENGTKTTRNGNCSPKGLVLVVPERRVPVVDREAGIAVAFVHFTGSLPDFHMFKYRNGRIENIQSVIGPRAPSTGWPDDKNLSRRVVPADEQMSRPLNVSGPAPQMPGEAVP